MFCILPIGWNIQIFSIRYLLCLFLHTQYEGAFCLFVFISRKLQKNVSIPTKEIIKKVVYLVIANFCEMQNQYSSPIKSFRITLITRISGIIFSVYIIFWVKFDYLFWMDLSKHAHNRWSIRVQISLQANITFPLIWLSKSLRKHFHLNCKSLRRAIFFVQSFSDCELM